MEIHALDEVLFPIDIMQDHRFRRTYSVANYFKHSVLSCMEACPVHCPSPLYLHINSSYLRMILDIF